MGSRLKPKLVSYTPEEFTFEFETRHKGKGKKSLKPDDGWKLDPGEILSPGDEIAVQGPDGLLIGEVKSVKHRRTGWTKRAFRGVAVRPKRR